MTLTIDKYRSLYVARSLNGYVLVYSNSYKGITAPFTKDMSSQMFHREFEYTFSTLDKANEQLQEIEIFLAERQKK
jgi:hypothetical protein